MAPSSYTATAQTYLRVEVGGDLELNTQSHCNVAQFADLKTGAAVPVFTSGVIAQHVIGPLKLNVTPEEPASSVSATRTPEVVSMRVSVEASTPRQAQVPADEIVRRTAEEMTELEGSDSPVKISLLSSAELVSATRSPVLVTCVGVGLLAGLVLGYVWIPVQELLDKSLKGPEDVRKTLSAPVFGALPKDPSPLRLGRDAQTEVEERSRATHTNVLHALSREARQIMIVTSAGPQEGASATAAGLAWVPALSGHRIVLIGGDLRSPSTVGVPDAPGFAEVLVRTACLSQVLVESGIPDLEFLPVGDMPGNPSELLGGHNISDLLHYLATNRIVIINAPPTCCFIDTVVLAEYTSGALPVVRAERTSAERLRETALTVGQGGGHILDVMLTSMSNPGHGSRNVQAGVTHAKNAAV